MSNVRVAGIRVPADACRTGVLIVGKSGSGKTSVAKKLLIDVFGLRDPVLAVDLADELTEFATARSPPGTPIHRIDVHTPGGTALDFAKVLTSETRRMQFAAKVCPELKNDPQPFFMTRARGVVQAAMRILHLCSPEAWTLGDLLRLALNRNLVSVVAKAVPDSGGDPYGDLGASDSAQDVAGTVTSRLQPLAVYAALADRAAKLVSPLVLVREEKGVMVLVWKDRYQAALEAMFSFVVDIVAEEKLSQVSDRRLWIFGDEVRSLRPLDSLPNVARRGRKSSVCMVLTMHEIAGMHDRYGKDRAEEMLALLDHKVFLKIGGPQTAKWASEYLGATEVIEDVPPLDGSGRDTSYKRSVKERRNVMPDELRRLASADAARDRVEGYVDFPGMTAEFECPFLADVRAPAPVVRPSVPPEWEFLRLMSMDDIGRLKVPNTKAVREALT